MVSIKRIVFGLGAGATVLVSGYLIGAPITTTLPVAMASFLVVYHNGITAAEIESAIKDILTGHLVNFTEGVAVSVVQGPAPANSATVTPPTGPQAGSIVTAANVATITAANGTTTPSAPIGSVVVPLGNGWYDVTTPSGKIVATKLDPLTN